MADPLRQGYTIRVESTTNCSIVFPWGWRNPRVVSSNQNRIGYGVWPANRLARRILCIWEKWQKPMFPPNLWSVFDQNVLGIPRTQNYAESFHQYIHTVIGRPHIGVFHLLIELQKNSKTTNAEIEKIERGNPPPKKKPKFVIKEKT